MRMNKEPVVNEQKEISWPSAERNPQHPSPSFLSELSHCISKVFLIQYFLSMSTLSAKIVRSSEQSKKCSKFPNYFSTLLFSWHLWQTEQHPGWREERKKQRVRGEKAHLQMARVGVYWQEDQNTSVVSRGTRATHCDWPDGSQELKPRSLQYNRGWRECKRDR